MHFPIITLEDINTKPEDFIKDLGYDDATLNFVTDYYGSIYTLEERSSVIKSDWLTEFFDGYAVVDKNAETIEFLDAETIDKNFRRYLKELTEHLKDEADRETLSGFDLRQETKDYKGNSVLFYHNERYYPYAETSFGLIENSRYFAGKKYKIGNIFDAHI